MSFSATTETTGQIHLVDWAKRSAEFARQATNTHFSGEKVTNNFYKNRPYKINF